MRISLATRIFLGYAVVLLTFGAVCVFSVAEMHQNQLELRLVSEGYVQLVQSAAAIESFHKNHERDSHQTETSLSSRRSLIRLARLFLDPKLDEAQAKVQEVMAFAPATEQAFLKKLFNQLNDLQKGYGQYEDEAERLFAFAADGDLEKDDKLKTLNQMESALGRNTVLIRHTLEERMRQRVTEAESRERRTGLTIIGLSVAAIVIGLIMTALAARTLKPVRQLIEMVKQVAQGNYSARVQVRGNDDISTLAKAFDDMANSLKERESQLAEQQEALLRAEQLAAVGRVSAQVAHEIRNPLSAIGLNTEMLGDQLARATFPTENERHETQELLSSVSREIDRLNTLTEHYLGMARLPQPILEREDLQRLIDSVLQFSHEELQRSGIRVVNETHTAHFRALFDEGQMRQVLLNLIRNSREAMPEGGTLTLRAHAREGFVVLTLSDTGRGMTPNEMSRIFEPFFSTKKGGTGLGLALTREILQAHGGSIVCESQPGKGTTFTLKLPSA